MRESESERVNDACFYAKERQKCGWLSQRAYVEDFPRAGATSASSLFLLPALLSPSLSATLNSYPLSPAMARLGFLSLALLSLQAFIGGGLAEVCFGHLVRSHAN